MSHNLKFEFDCDEVFEGIKAGVIKELSESTYSNIIDQVTRDMKKEVSDRFQLAYPDVRAIKNEIQLHVEEKVFQTLIDEIRQAQKAKFQQIMDNSLQYDQHIKDLKKTIVEETVNLLYENLIDNVQREVKKVTKKFTDSFMNNIANNNVSISGNKNQKSISKEEYENLLHRDKVLTALEHGGVDNWEWYGDSLSQFLDDDDE